jgi:hypothetical protein
MQNVAFKYFFKKSIEFRYFLPTFASLPPSPSAILAPLSPLPSLSVASLPGSVLHGVHQHYLLEFQQMESQPLFHNHRG